MKGPRGYERLWRDGKLVAIGHRALLMLETMVEARGEIVTKAEMMAWVWAGVIVEEGNLARGTRHPPGRNPET